METTNNHWIDLGYRSIQRATGGSPRRLLFAVVVFFGLMIASTHALGGTQIQWPVKDTTFQSSWPSDSEWIALHVLDDPANDVSPSDNIFNFVGDSNNPGFYIAKKSVSGANYLFFRIRVNWSGTVTEPTCSTLPSPPSTAGVGCDTATPFGGTSTGKNPGSILLYAQSGSGTKPEYAFAWDFKENVYQHGMEMVKLNTGGGTGPWSGVKMDDVDGANADRLAPDFDNNGRTGVVTKPYFGKDAYIRTVDSVACVGAYCGGADASKVLFATTFVDFAISCDYLNYVTGYTPTVNVNLTCGQNWYFQIGSISDKNDHNFPDVDIAGGAGLSTVVNDSMKGPIATYALVDNFRATVLGGQVLVEWDTQVEAGTLGFELERQTGPGEFELVHEGLISGHSPAGEGGSYRFIDATALPGFTNKYRLTEVETSGNRRVVGEYTVTPEFGGEWLQSDRLQMKNDPGKTTFTPRELNTAEKARLASRRGERAAKQEVLPAANPYAVGKAKAVNKAAIGVRESGLYFIGAAELEQALNWPKGKVSSLIQSRQLRLTHQDNDIAWLPAPKAQGLYFYGQASSSIYDAENVYVVQQGTAMLMDNTRVPAAGLAAAESFPSTVNTEENLFAATVLARDPEQDYWYWASFNAAGSACTTNFLGCRSREFIIDAPNATAAGSGSLVVYLRGASALPAEPDHLVGISLNGTPIGEGQWDGVTDYSLSLPFDQTLLKTGTNTVRVDAMLEAGVAYNYFYLDRLELTYQRIYQAAGDQLQATGAANRRIVASGFASDAISLFDLTDRTHPKKVAGARIDGVKGNYRISFVPATSTAPYLMLTSAAFRQPSSLRGMKTTGLANRNAGANYLIIGPEDFAESAQRLMDFRGNQGLTGKFVPLQAIYDEYGAGQKTPHAIRSFLAYAWRHWRDAPEYLLLGGKGTFDPKDYLGYGTDRLPALMAMTPAGIIAADQRFADFNADGIGDIPIGRLPAVTVAEFSAMVDKLTAYEDSAAHQCPTVVLLADNPDTAGNFTADSETMAERLLQAGYSDDDILRLYLEEMSSGTAYTQLLGALNSGVRLLNYFGHSGVTALDHNLLTVSDAAGLTNLDRLPMMAGMTCYMNRFEYPAMTSLGEALLLNPRGGAAAVWSSGGWSYNSQARQLDEGLFKALFESETDTVGDAVLQATSEYVKAGNPADVPSVYNLLGDPASRWYQ